MKTLFDKSDITTQDLEVVAVREPKTTTVKNGDGSESVIKTYTLELKRPNDATRIAAGKSVILSIFATVDATNGGYMRGTYADLVQSLDDDGKESIVGKLVKVDLCTVHFATPYFWLYKDDKGKSKRHLNPDGKTPSVVTDITFARMDGDTMSFDRMIERRIIRILAEKKDGGGFMDTVTLGSDRQYYIGEQNISTKAVEGDDIP